MSTRVKWILLTDLLWVGSPSAAPVSNHPHTQPPAPSCRSSCSQLHGCTENAQREFLQLLSCQGSPFAPALAPPPPRILFFRKLSPFFALHGSHTSCPSLLSPIHPALRSDFFPQSPFQSQLPHSNPFQRPCSTPTTLCLLNQK